MSSALFDIACQDQQGQWLTLKQLGAKAYLVVNTASKCGFTPQYLELEALWQHFREHGLMVLGFPCNQFGAQEPGTDEEIAEFCSFNYGVSFPVFKKVEVNGANAHPLFTELKQRAPGIFGTESIKWNFTKFLISADGKVERFAPKTSPKSIESAILDLLNGA